MHFPQRLHAIMKQKELSNYKLAKELGVHQTTIRNWLDGKTVPKFETIERIALILDVSPLQLLFDNDVETVTKADLLKQAAIEGVSFTAPVSDIQRLEKALHQLNDKGKEKVADYAEVLTHSPEFTE